MAKFLFAPFSIVAGLLAGFVGKKLFDAIWGLVDEEEPPEGAHREAPWVKLIAAAALQGAIFRAVKEASDRGSRQAFMQVTGTWPGQDKPEPE